jgi:aarF domain-containing kinase
MLRARTKVASASFLLCRGAQRTVAPPVLLSPLVYNHSTKPSIPHLVTTRPYTTSDGASYVKETPQSTLARIVFLRYGKYRSFSYRMFVYAGRIGTLFVIGYIFSELYHEFLENNKNLHNEYPEFYQFIQKYLRPAAQLYEGLIRYSRTISVAFAVGLDYKLTKLKHGKQYDEDEQIRSDLHTRSAERFLRLFMKNGCVYIKMGQYMASLHHVLPDEYCHVLSVLQDKAPSVEYSQIERVILDDLGKPVDELFSDFEENPFAAASLAQVHRAKTKDGQTVAVKVQYPLVRFNFEGDMLTNDVVLWLLKFAFPGYDFQFMGPELKETLRSELDFITEAKNARRARDNFAAQKRTDVYVPSIVDHCSGSRVMTTELITDSVKVSDIAGIRRLGLDPAEVARITLEAFAEQIYWHGFVHADPHPGNILIRVNPAWQEPSKDNKIIDLHGAGLEHDQEIPKTQVVILDHGLYREMSDEVRQTYCRIWKALVLKDDEQLQKYCAQMGVEDYKTYALVVMMRAYDGATVGMNKGMTKKQVREALDMLKNQMESITQVLKQLHPDMMFVLRNQNLLRSINVQLGVPVNRFTIMARKATDGINQDSSRKGLLSALRTIKERFFFEVHLKMFEIMASLMHVYFSMQIALGWKERLVLPEDDVEVSVG